MINAPTQGAESTLFNMSSPQAVKRIGARTFWALLALELMVIVIALAWVLAATTTSHTPVAGTSDLMPVRDAVWARLMGTVNDPLIEVQPGISVRESNLRGFSLNDVTYYYFVEGQQNFDPLSQGLVSAAQVEILLRDDGGPLPLVIYTIRK